MWSVVGILCLTWTVTATAQEPLWKKHTDAGGQASQQGRYAEAESRFQAALTMALQVSSANVQVPTSVSNLAAVYTAQGEHAKAESVYQRVLALREEALGAWHSEVAALLTDYAALLRAQYPWQSRLPWSLAARLAARAQRIWRAEEEIEKGSRREGPASEWPAEEAETFDDGHA